MKNDLLRPLKRSPRLAIVTIALTALGVSACTAVFALYESAMLRDRPGVVDDSSLVEVFRTREGSGVHLFSFEDYRSARTGNSTLVDLTAFRFEPEQVGIATETEPEAATLMWVTSNYFGVTGTKFSAGPGFTQTEEPLAEIVVSNRYWKNNLSSDPLVIGRKIVVNGHPATIVGVTEPGFTSTTVLAPDVWAPFPMMRVLEPQTKILSDRRFSIMTGLGRLKPGVTLHQAQADLSLIAQRLAREYPESHEKLGLGVAASTRFPGIAGVVVSAFLGGLGVLTLLAAFVASANIAGLMLASGAARRREFAIRAAIGASRKRIIAGVIREQIVLFGAGGIAGALLSYWLVDALRWAIPQLPMPVGIDISVSPLALAFAVVLSILLGMAFSIGPALTGTRFDLVAAIRGQEQPGGSRLLSPRGIFLTFQLTLSLALLTVAAGLARTLWAAANTSPGFDPARIEFVQLNLRSGGLNSTSGAAFSELLLSEASALPGVERAAVGISAPLSGSGYMFGPLYREDRQKGQPALANWNYVSPGYFAMLGAPIVRGRDFTPADRTGSPRVAIINESFARAMWPGSEAVGQFLADYSGAKIEVIGVVKDVSFSKPGETTRIHFFAPIAQNYFDRQVLLVKSRDGASLLPQIRELVRKLQPNLPIHNAQTVEASASVGLAPQRAAAGVALATGFLVLILAATGVYGVTVFWAATRTREFGVRAALGATPGELVRLALAGSLRLTALATVLGVVCALGLFQALRSGLGNIEANPLVIAGVGVTFAAVVITSSFLPAFRASRVDPMIALRND